MFVKVFTGGINNNHFHVILKIHVLVFSFNYEYSRSRFRCQVVVAKYLWRKPLMPYTNLNNIIEDIEHEINELIMSTIALIDYFCPFCHKESVHRMFHENPDGSYDDVGLKCKNCGASVWS